MSANNEASIRVTANTAPFQSEMRSTTSFVRHQGDRMSAGLKDSLTEGFNAGKTAAKEMGQSVKGLVSQVASLGGAIGAGALVVSAVNAQKANIALANSLSSVQSRYVDVVEVQELIERSADDARDSMENMRTSLALMGAVSDKIDIEDALVRSSLQARRLGVEGEKISEIYSRVAAAGLGKTAEEVENVTEQIGRTAQAVLGVSLEEAFDPNDVLEFVTFMQRGNIELNAALNLFGLMEGVTKDFGKGIEVVEELGDALNDVKELQAIRDASGLTRKELNANMTVAENFNTVLGKGPTAIKALTDALGFQARQGLENLLGTEFLDKAVQGKGKIAKSEIEEAQRKVRAIFESEAAFQADRVAMERRNAEVTGTTAAKFQEAINKMEKAMQSDRVADAISTVADALPTLIEPIAKFVKFAAEHPGTALATAVAGKVGLTFAGSVVQTAMAKGVAALFARAVAVQAASGAASVATRAVLGVGGGMGAASAAAGGGALAAATTGLAAGASVLGAGLAGYGVTTALLDTFGGTEALESMGANAFGNDDRKRNAFRGIGSGGPPPSRVERAIKEGAAKGTAETASPSFTQSVSAAEREREIAETERKLMGALGRIASGADEASKGLGKVAKTAGGVGPGSSRGTPEVPQKDGAAPPS